MSFLQNMAMNCPRQALNYRIKNLNWIGKIPSGYFGLLQLATVLGVPPDEFNQMLEESKTLDDNDQNPRAELVRSFTRLHRDWKLLDIERAVMR